MEPKKRLTLDDGNWDFMAEFERPGSSEASATPRKEASSSSTDKPGAVAASSSGRAAPKSPLGTPKPKPVDRPAEPPLEGNAAWFREERPAADNPWNREGRPGRFRKGEAVSRRPYPKAKPVTNPEEFPDWSRAYDEDVPALKGEEFPPLVAPVKAGSKVPATYTGAAVVVDPKLMATPAAEAMVKAFPGETRGGSLLDANGEQKPILPKKQTEVKAAPEPKQQEAIAKGIKERPPLPKAPVVKPRPAPPPVPVFLPTVPPPMAPPQTPPPTPRAVEPVKEEEMDAEFEEEPGVADVEMRGILEEEAGEEDSEMRSSEQTEPGMEPRATPSSTKPEDKPEELIDPETGIRKTDVHHFHQWLACLTFEAPRPEVVKAMFEHVAAMQSGRSSTIRSAEAIDQVNPAPMDNRSVASSAPATTEKDDRPPLARKRNKIAAAEVERKSERVMEQPREETQGAARTTKAMTWLQQELRAVPEDAVTMETEEEEKRCLAVVLANLR